MTVTVSRDVEDGFRRAIERVVCHSGVHDALFQLFIRYVASGDTDAPMEPTVLKAQGKRTRMNRGRVIAVHTKGARNTPCWSPIQHGCWRCPCGRVIWDGR